MNKTNLVYGVSDRPGFFKTIVFALQQVLAILAATIVVPVIINGKAGLIGENAMSQSAALLGAGVGQLVLNIGEVKLTSVACALILGIIVNLITSKKTVNNDAETEAFEDEVEEVTE